MKLNNFMRAFGASLIGMFCFAFGVTTGLMSGTYLREHFIVEDEYSKWDTAFGFGGCFTLSVVALLLGFVVMTKGLSWILDRMK